MARFFCKCVGCGATGFAKGYVDVQGDELMTGEIVEIAELLDHEHWEGGLAECNHEGDIEVISEVDQDYD